MDFPTHKLDWALGYMRAGFWVLPLLDKGCHIPGWGNLRMKEPDLRVWFADPRFNVGLNLCERLLDVDLDADEARRLAHLWPATPLYFYRSKGKPGVGHYLYRARGIPQGSEDIYKLDDKLIEIRWGEHKQKLVMAAGSIHPAGDPILIPSWPPPQPAEVDFSVLQAVARKVSGIIALARSWPAVGQGQSHDYALAALGGLVQIGCDPELAGEMVREAAKLVGDKDHERRITDSDVERAAQMLREGTPMRGFPWIEEQHGCAGLGQNVRRLCHLAGERPQEQPKVVPVAARPEKGKPQVLDGGGGVEGPAVWLEVKRMSEVVGVDIRWLWSGRIPLGRITLLAGMPGLGKSLLTADLAARISTGRAMPDGAVPPQGGTLFIQAEDDPADTLKPRLVAAGADCAAVFAAGSVMSRKADGEVAETFWSVVDTDLLHAILDDHPGIRLLVVDPIGSFVGGGVDAHRDNEVRSALMPLDQLAHSRGVAVLLVAHVRKGQAAHADDMVLGSRAFTGLSRSVLHLVEDEMDPERRLLLPGKNNLAPKLPGLAFRIADGPRLVWDENVVHTTADDAYRFAASMAGKDAPEKIDAAEEWLRNFLRNGKQEAKDVFEAAEEAGISERTLIRAKKKLGVVSARPGGSGPWFWTLMPTC